ncbi:Hypothetical_protein [Hexamita inflata]|uniref:Hypothetical_protein n=1 Tax=Hexamita inflata TaxID=28002 RepID=A0AA86UP15_9EUKA|nr:Hypothetical protein HINF_LOCUS46772 [Hexamita inflata]
MATHLAIAKMHPTILKSGNIWACEFDIKMRETTRYCFLAIFAFKSINLICRKWVKLVWKLLQQFGRHWLKLFTIAWYLLDVNMIILKNQDSSSLTVIQLWLYLALNISQDLQDSLHMKIMLFVQSSYLPLALLWTPLERYL